MEVDAIPPTILRSIVEAAIVRHVDHRDDRRCLMITVREIDGQRFGYVLADPPENGPADEHEDGCPAITSVLLAAMSRWTK